VASGTPVLASHIDGNIGMLGDDYAGYFPWNNEAALAALLVVCRESQSLRDGTDNAIRRDCAQPHRQYVVGRMISWRHA
jgi:hypothetical protein